MSTARHFSRALAIAVTFGVVATGIGATPVSAAPQAVSMVYVVAAANTSASIAGLQPADIASAYGLSGGVSGGTLGIVIPYDTPALESDLATYRAQFGLPACTTANGCFSKVDQNGGTSYPAVNTDWSLEASLDVDSVSAACAGCNILVVEASNTGMAALGTAVNTAVSLGASAVSMSWGIRETIDASYYQNRYFNHPGVALVAATGDNSYPQAYMPATFSSVLAVGGTTLSRSGTAAAQMAPRGALTVTNGSASAATAMSAAQEHAATLAAAKANFASAQGRATAAGKALTAAKKAVAARKMQLATATTRYLAAVKRAKFTHTASMRRSLAAVRKAYSSRVTAYRKATALVTSRSKAMTASSKSVSAAARSVAAAQAVVNADNAPSSAPIAPVAVITPVQTVSSVPTVPVVDPTPVTTVTPPISAPLPQSAPTPAPTQIVTPIPDPPLTQTPTPTPTPVTTNAAPTASFSRSATNLTVSLDASASSDSDGTIASYAWTFGDGSSAFGVTTSHTYAAAGTYTITLTVTDNSGASTPVSAPVTVTAPAAVSAARNGWMETAWSGAGSGCSTYISKPAWQTDSACSTRTVADISADADPSTGLAVFDTAAVAQGYTTDGWLVIGGTSLATPLIASMVVRSGHATNYSDASPLYANPSAYWDVTSGGNGSCSGSAVCTAGVGYDGPTGLGTPKSLASF